MRTHTLLFALALSAACADQFEKAERQLDNPSGSVEDEDGVTVAVQAGSSQDNSVSIIETTSESLEAIPFALGNGQRGLPALDAILSQPEFDHPAFRQVRALTNLALGSAPLAISTTDAGNIDVAGATGGACSGTINFTVESELNDNLISGSAQVEMGFDAVTCGDDSVDGDIAFRADFDGATFFVKVVEVVDATIVADGVENNVQFALRFETEGLVQAAVDMSVEVNGDSYTLKINGDLALGEASFEIVGEDGSLVCEADNFEASCEGPNGSITIQY